MCGVWCGAVLWCKQSKDFWYVSGFVFWVLCCCWLRVVVGHRHDCQLCLSQGFLAIEVWALGVVFVARGSAVPVWAVVGAAAQSWAVVVDDEVLTGLFAVRHESCHLGFAKFEGFLLVGGQQCSADHN